jgi:hypothetical protein
LGLLDAEFEEENEMFTMNEMNEMNALNEMLFAE